MFSISVKLARSRLRYSRARKLEEAKMKVKNFLKGYPDDIAVFVHSLPKLLLSAYYLYPKCSSSIMKEDIKQMLPVRTNHNCISYDMVSYVIVSSMVYVIVSFETERGT